SFAGDQHVGEQPGGEAENDPGDDAHIDSLVGDPVSSSGLSCWSRVWLVTEPARTVRAVHASVLIVINLSASRRRAAASSSRAASGIPSGRLPPLAARSAALLMYLAARRSNAGGNMAVAELPAWLDAASAVICPSPDSTCP